MSVLSSGLQQSRSRIWSDQAKTTGKLGWGFLFFYYSEDSEREERTRCKYVRLNDVVVVFTSLGPPRCLWWLLKARGWSDGDWRIEGFCSLFSPVLFHIKHFFSIFYYFCSIIPQFLPPYIFFYTSSPLPHILYNVFVASLVASSSAAWADIGVWFVRVNVIQQSIRSIRPMLRIPGGLGLCFAKLLMEVKTLSGKPLRAQQAQKNEPPLSLHIRSSATVADPSQTPSHSAFVCSSLWTRDS